MRPFHGLLPLVVVGAAFSGHRGLAAESPPSTNPPDRGAAGSPADIGTVVEEIRGAGGVVEYDESQPAKPIIVVQVTGFRATDALLERLKPLATLQDLRVTNCGITDAGLRQLNGLAEIRTLDLSNTKTTDEGLKTLASFPKLEVLILSGCKTITGAGLLSLEGLKNLQKVHLGNTGIDDAGLAHLAGLTNLRELGLSGTPISDAGLKQLRSLTQLQLLRLNDTKVTDAGLQTVQAFTSLRGLGLEGTETSDEGLQYLKTLTKLEKLSLSGKNSVKAVKSLRKALPGTFILHLSEKPTFDQQETDRQRKRGERIGSLARLVAETVSREAGSQEAADQKKEALAIIHEIVGDQESIDVGAGFAVADLAFMPGANDKAIEIMEKLVRLQPKEKSPGIVVPVDCTATLRIGTYARYGNNPNRATAAYTSLLSMARGSPMVYSDEMAAIPCYFYLAEIEAHFHRDPAKAVAWLDRIVQLRPPRFTLGSPGAADRDRQWRLFQGLARHEMALLQGRQPNWRGPLDDGTLYMQSVCFLLADGLLGLTEYPWMDRRSDAMPTLADCLLQIAARSDVSRLDRAMAQYQLGFGAIQGKKSTQAQAYFNSLLASDSYFAPAGGVSLARCQMEEGKGDEAKQTLRNLIIRFPSLKMYLEDVARRLEAVSPRKAK